MSQNQFQRCGWDGRKPLLTGLRLPLLKDFLNEALTTAVDWLCATLPKSTCYIQTPRWWYRGAVFGIITDKLSLFRLKCLADCCSEMNEGNLSPPHQTFDSICGQWQNLNFKHKVEFYIIVVNPSRTLESWIFPNWLIYLWNFFFQLPNSHVFNE